MTLPLSDFWDLLGHGPAPAPALTENRQSVRAQSGQHLPFTRGPRLWTWPIALKVLPNIAASGVSALIDRASRQSFLAYPVAHAYPQADPDGAILGAAAPEVFGLPSDRHQIRIDGLPATYVLTRGDFLSVLYDSGARRSLHRIVVGGAASSGLSPILHIEPSRPLGVAVNDPVTLIRPAARFGIVENSVSGGTQGRVNTAGAGFTIVETP